jgi:ethanolaminephosphotransferase
MQSLSSHGLPRFIAASLAVAASLFKLAFTNEDSPELMSNWAKIISSLNDQLGVTLLVQPRIAFIGLIMALAYTLFNRHSQTYSATIRSIHDLLVLFLITQSRATNIPLLLIFELTFYLLSNVDLSLVEITTTSLLFHYMSFFAFGGSNAISSIDLSSAYNGVGGYNVLAVGILTFVGNWTGPIFWTSATNILLLRLHHAGNKNILSQHLALLTVFVTSSLFFVMAACTMLRTHLFIWTVFSPKYLYSMAWSLGQHLCINVAFGSLLYWLGTTK